MTLLVILQMVFVLETHTAKFTSVFQQLLLISVHLPFVGCYILCCIKFLVAQLALELPLVSVRVHVVD